MLFEGLQLELQAESLHLSYLKVLFNCQTFINLVGILPYQFSQKQTFAGLLAIANQYLRHFNLSETDVGALLPICKYMRIMESVSCCQIKSNT